MEACLEKMRVQTVGHWRTDMGTGIWLYGPADGRSNWPRTMVSPGRSWPSHARGRLTRRTVPALRKGRSRMGPGKTTSNGSRRLEIRLGSKKTFYKTLAQTQMLEVVKRAVGISIGLRKVRDWASWRSRRPPKPKKSLRKLSPWKRWRWKTSTGANLYGETARKKWP
jgi:hypothetical protein